MKKLSLLTAVAVFGAVELAVSDVQAAVTTNGIVSTISIVGSFSPSTSPVITTNSGGSSTVITSVYTSKPLKILTKDMLNLLATEYNVSFPSGARLAYDLTSSPEGFVVLDKSGNIFLNVSSNGVDSSYRFDLTNNSSNQAISGKATETDTFSSTNTSETLSIVEDNYSIVYTDGRGNDFKFTGLVKLKVSAVVNSTETEYKTVSIFLTGFGGGKFFNTADSVYDEGVFTKATWQASGKNIPVP